MDYSYIPTNRLDIHAQSGVQDLMHDDIETVVYSDYLTVIQTYALWDSARADEFSDDFTNLPTLAKYSGVRFYRMNSNINDDHVVAFNGTDTPAVYVYHKGHKTCQMETSTISDVMDALDKLLGR
jgi:hypothetical protein